MDFFIKIDGICKNNSNEAIISTVKCEDDKIPQGKQMGRMRIRRKRKSLLWIVEDMLMRE